MSEQVVLFADDNPDDVDLTLLALHEIGFPYKVIVARDGEEALDYLFCRGAYANRDSSQLPALILLDVRMPKVDGLQVLEGVRASPVCKNTPVVMLTTSDEPRDRATAERLGASLYLKKPLAFPDLCSLLGKLQTLIPPRR
ncbi:MAG TPA: response regulator [Elusimicrobiota bacterium]|nr:response regulator [Elusimicrobiota bacterium]